NVSFHVPQTSGGATLSPETAARMREHVVLIEDVLRGIVADGIASGDFAADLDVDATVRIVNGLLVGSSAKRYSRPALEAFVLRGLGADDGGRGSRLRSARPTGADRGRPGPSEAGGAGQSSSARRRARFRRAAEPFPGFVEPAACSPSPSASQSIASSSSAGSSAARLHSGLALSPSPASMTPSGAGEAITQHVSMMISATTATPQRRKWSVSSVLTPTTALTASAVSRLAPSSSGSATAPIVERSTPVSTVPPSAPEWPQEPRPP